MVEALVAAMLDADEPEARRIIDEMDSPIVAYLGSKHALGRAVRRRVRVWGDARVRLNGVAPGPVDTPLLEATKADPATRKEIENIDIRQITRGQAKLGLVAIDQNKDVAT